MGMNKKAQEFIDSLSPHGETPEERELRFAELEIWRAEEVRLNQEDQLPLVADLNAAGWTCESISDLVHTRLSYPQAIPVLIKHLRLPHRPDVRDGIIRALNVKEVRGMLPVEEVIAMFKAEPLEGNVDAKSYLGNLIVLNMTQNDLPKLLELIGDETQGDGRTMLPMGLQLLPYEEAKKKLEPLTTHPHMWQFAKKAMSIVERKEKARLARKAKLQEKLFADRNDKSAKVGSNAARHRKSLPTDDSN